MQLYEKGPFSYLNKLKQRRGFAGWVNQNVEESILGCHVLGLQLNLVEEEEEEEEEGLYTRRRLHSETKG